MQLSPSGQPFGHIRAVAFAVALVTLAALALTAVGCKKKEGPGVEPVSTGSKPPVVKRKPKHPPPVAGAGAAATAAAAPEIGTRPPPPGTEPAPAAAPLPVAAAASPAVAAEPVAAPAPGGLPAPEPVPMPPAAPPGAPAPGEFAANPAGRPPRVGPNPLGGADPAAAAPAPPDRPQPVPEPAPRMPEPVAAPPPDPAPMGREPSEPALDITGYLSAADLERVLGTKAKLRRSDLPGTAPSPTYNAIYFAPEKGDGFGISLQVWRDANLAESRTRFNTMRNTYSNVAPTNKVAEQGFRAYFNGVVTLVFANVRRPLVAALSCSTKVCNADQIIELANRANERLQ